MRIFPVVAAAIAIVVSGCFTVTTERVGRPPSPAEIAHINDTARHCSLSVLTAPDEASADQIATTCAAGGCGLPPWARGRAAPVAISAADAGAITLVLADGAHVDVPMQSVASIDVGGTNRGKTAGAGAAIGATTMLGLLGMGYLIGHMEPSAGGCDATCARTFAIATVGGAAVGALVGAIVGNTRRFTF